MRFSQRVYFWSGVYGILALLPMFFLEDTIGRAFPPATNHPEQYYAFLGVALAWQPVFLIIARDPRRYRSLMLPAIAEKLVPAGAVLGLYGADRVAALTTAPFLVDLLIGVLFVWSYTRTREPVSAPATDSTA